MLPWVPKNASDSAWDVHSIPTLTDVAKAHHLRRFLLIFPNHALGLGVEMLPKFYLSMKKETSGQ